VRQALLAPELTIVSRSAGNLQVQGGHATVIDVDLDLDDGWVTITDDGRGIPTSMHPRTGKSALETVRVYAFACARVCVCVWGRCGCACEGVCSLGVCSVGVGVGVVCVWVLRVRVCVRARVYVRL